MLDGYNTAKGGSPVPAPVGAAGAGVRPGAGQPAQRRPGPHPPAAGGPRLRDLEAGARRRPVRPRRAHRAAQHGEAVPHHRLDWNLLDFATDMRALTERTCSSTPRRSWATRPSTARTPTWSTSRRSRRPSRRSSPPRSRGAGVEHGEVRCEGRARPAGVDRHRGRLQRRDHGRAWPPASPGAGRQGLQGRPVTDARRSRGPSPPAIRCSTGAGASANAAKIAGYFGVTAVALSRCPPGTSRCCSALGPPWCRPSSPRRRPPRRKPLRPRRRPRPGTTARPAALSQ
jgi:hypothetical protein